MKYIQFFQLSSGYIPGSIPPKFDDAYKKPIEACGPDSIKIIDGRWSNKTIAEIARRLCLSRGFCGYRIYSGESFTRSKPISGYWPVPSKVDNSALSATYGN